MDNAILVKTQVGFLRNLIVIRNGNGSKISKTLQKKEIREEKIANQTSGLTLKP